MEDLKFASFLKRDLSYRVDVDVDVDMDMYRDLCGGLRMLRGIIYMPRAMAHESKSQLCGIIGLEARSSRSAHMYSVQIPGNRGIIHFYIQYSFDVSKLRRGHRSNMTWKSKKQERSEDHPMCFARRALGQ